MPKTREQIKEGYAAYPDSILEHVVRYNRIAATNPGYTQAHEEHLQLREVASVAEEILRERAEKGA